MLTLPEEYRGQPGELFECDVCGMEDIQYGILSQRTPPSPGLLPLLHASPSPPHCAYGCYECCGLRVQIGGSTTAPAVAIGTPA